jgi:uncharacterized protein DUF4349
MKNILLITSVFSLSLVASNCGGFLSKERSGPDQVAEFEKDANKNLNQQNNIADTTRASTQKLPGSGTSSSNTDWDKKIIKTADVNIEVKNYKSFNESVKEKIHKYGGYIAQEQQNENDYKIEDVITIKVPVDQFDYLINELTPADEKVYEKKIASDDVTTAVVDTKSRLEAKKEVRLRYLDLLRQAKNMEEILNVQHEINGIQEEIEAANGRIEYLSHASVFSTINLTYFQVLNATAKDPEKISFGTKLWEAFKNGWEWIGDIFIGLISIWPLYLAGFLCWVAYKRLKPAKIVKTKTEELKN